MNGKRVLVVDDVISTGGSLKALDELAKQTKCEIVGQAAVLAEGDAALLGHIFAVIAQLAQQTGLENGYRVVSNVGPDSGQTVPHLHFHVLGGAVLPV